MDLFWYAFKLRSLIRRNIWGTIINQFQHLFQGKSQKSFFMLFAYNQQLGSEAQAEWWPLAVYQALAGLAQSAQARSSVKRYQKISRLWVLAESRAWPSQDDGAVRIIIRLWIPNAAQHSAFRHKPQGIFGPSLTQIRAEHSPPTPAMTCDGHIR